MVENIDLNAMAEQLNEEFAALIDEREDIRSKAAKLRARSEEIERRLSGIQQTLQGLSLYFTAQETPTELTKKTTNALTGILASMRSISEQFTDSAEREVPKTLSECCRDILRQKDDWMSPIQVREALYAAGFDFSNYTSNPLSSIHTTLKRLAQDELETESRSDGQVYRWKTEESGSARERLVKEGNRRIQALEPPPGYKGKV